MRHFLAPNDFSPAEQARAIDLAAELTRDRWSHRPFNGPRSVAIISDKPTLRTQLSFQVGIADLGGNALMVDGNLAGVGTRESIPDSARVLGRQVAQIVWRTGAHERIEEMARHAGVPVINALTDDHHPCQVLADLLTIAQHQGDGTAGSLRGLSMTYLGDGANNMSHSYLLGAALAGMHITIASPAGYQPDPAVVESANLIAADTGATIRITDEPGAFGADAVITDTWVSMGQDGAEERARVFAPYRVTTELMETVPQAIAMHCLPAYRGKEIDAEVIDGPRSVVWDEAANRLPVQKAVMIMLDEWAGQDGEAR
ncbi:ornithine carbamoyltransferase [Naumannella halotolerans]|uniref:Ornithine carbamoyltransferase n=1 Tax=Naumannella halotolerans TaxID=993414 RepID=A0A4R7J942_9ACTN|nr:ornithine carbamoyltransferase [Naumannella halotolerans]TDT33087.1 ornithine carbamoyltransferase [Naumannella halotolerans]